MTVICVQLPDSLKRKVDLEVRLTGRSRSEVVRDAIAISVARRDHERFIAEYVAEATAGYSNPILRREAIQIAGELDAAGSESCDLAGGGDLGEQLRAESDDKWWE
jgi:predicted transcriptional regulator